MHVSDTLYKWFWDFSEQPKIADYWYSDSDIYSPIQAVKPLSLMHQEH